MHWNGCYFDLYGWDCFDFPEPLEPGQAYWLLTTDTVDIDVAGAYVSTTEDFAIPLQAGFHHIGNPFTFPIDWENSMVRRDGETVSIAEAQSRNWMRNKFWSWNRWYWRGHRNGQLEPWEGYAVRAFVDCELLIPPTPAEGGALPDPPEDLVYDWLVQMLASSGEFVDEGNYLGAADAASDGYDLMDSEDVGMMTSLPEDALPPGTERFEALVAPPVSLYFPHSDWGADSGPYMQDIRGAQPGDRILNVEIACDVPEGSSVALAWDEVVQVPDGLQLTIADLDGDGTPMDMSTESSYTFASAGEGSVRRFQVELSGTTSSTQEDPEVLPTAYKLHPTYPNPFGPSVTISYDLPKVSEVTLQIYDVSGRVVRVLVDAATEPGGQRQATWDGRDDSGRDVASGVYFCRLQAGLYAETQQVMLSR
jgi:hypothetical protein